MKQLPPPSTLLGSADENALVSFCPTHWHALRSRIADPAALAATDDAFANTLAMTAMARTVLVEGLPEAILGMYLLPDGGSPWVMTVLPTVDRLARAVVVSQTFIAECLERCPLLQSEMEHHDGASMLWFASLGFRNVGHGSMACWEMRRVDVAG